MKVFLKENLVLVAGIALNIPILLKIYTRTKTVTLRQSRLKKA